jgi:hypothetical protein
MIFIIVLISMISTFWLQGNINNSNNSNNKYKKLFNNIKLPLFISLFILFIHNNLVNKETDLLTNQKFFTNLHDF